MQETIILSDISEREFLRSLANNHNNFFNVRIFNGVALAKEVLLRNGIINKEKQISSLGQSCIIYDLAKDIPYFENQTFEDARHLMNSLNYARKLCRGDEESKLEEVLADGEFKDKNNALLLLYKKYKDYLKEHNYIDAIDIINLVIKKGYKVDAEFISFKETPLDPLNEELLKVVADNKYQVKTINEYAGISKKKLHDIEYANGYGTINEVEHLLGSIARNKIPYEDCVIALIDKSYVEHFLAYQDAYYVSFSFGNGLSITNFNAYKILNLLDKWNKGYNGTVVLKDLIYAPEFNTQKLFENVKLTELNPREVDEVIGRVGNLRITCEKDNKLSEYKKVISDKKELKLYPYVEALAEELYQGYNYLIKTYTRIESELDNKAINKVCSTIDEFSNYEADVDLEDIINVLNGVNIAKEFSRKGAIHLTDLRGALSCLRKHLFICGLNAKNFPGSPREDYLLLDSDLLRFKEEYVKDSNNKVKYNKQLLMDVLDVNNAFDSKIHLSYAGYNLADLKIENPSSVLFEIYKEEKGSGVSMDDFNKAIGEQYKYFDEDITRIKNIGVKYLEGIYVKKEDETRDEYGRALINHTISPSAADIYFSCPRHFYLTKILGIDEPSDDDPFKALPANDEGSLIHACMEDYGNHPDWSEDEFMDNAENKLNDYFKKRISIHDKDKEQITGNYIKMAKVGYESDPGFEVVNSERYLGPFEDPYTGLKFGGIVDRIEKLANGKYQIVDYKTYKYFKNEENDIDSCFQVVLYAYLLEQIDKVEVEKCVYRYLRLGRDVECEYNDKIKESLHDKLIDFKEALDTGNFPCTTEEDNCTYCKLANICGRGKEALEEEEEIDG